jgi:hypothetical protein
MLCVICNIVNGDIVPTETTCMPHLVCADCISVATAPPFVCQAVFASLMSLLLTTQSGDGDNVGWRKERGRCTPQYTHYYGNR